MAFATINFENPHTGALKQAPVGFSWTTFFFGFFPALLRGHWVGAIVQILLALITAGLSNLVFMFIYNKMYIKHLLGDGYKVSSSTHSVEHIEAKLSLKLPPLTT